MIRVLAASALLLVTAAPGVPALAQDAGTVVRSLQFPPKMRGIEPSKEEAKDRTFIDGLRGETRGIVVEERKKIIEVIEKNGLPSIDVEIFFDYNSAAITPQAEKSVITLGQALSDARLKGSNFLIAGHTDARGSDDYNQALSERRALSVKAFLVDTFHIDANTLIVGGFGEEKLKNTHDPEADENRRVQVVNLGSVKQVGN